MYDLLVGHEFKYHISLLLFFSSNLAIQEDTNGYVNVKGLTIRKCTTEEDAV